MEQPKNVIVITGPTATGKTALGVALCRRIGGEVISADSMQIYRGMDIGTAKVTPEEMQGVPHHLIDAADPWEDFSVSRWTDLASHCVDDILARGSIPVIVGGTGLYIDSLLSGRDFSAAADDGTLRQALGAEYDCIGGEAFRRKLAAVDPERAALLHPADKKRLVRAMEVYRLTGKPISLHDAETRARPPRYASLRFALSFARREDLYARIDRRVDQMAEAGLFEEVARLCADGKLSRRCTAMQAIGYKEPAAFLDGLCTREEAIAAIKQSSRRYAKRQLTWLRRDPELNWILWPDAPDPTAALDTVMDVIRSSHFLDF